MLSFFKGAEARIARLESTSREQRRAKRKKLEAEEAALLVLNYNEITINYRE